MKNRILPIVILMILMPVVVANIPTGPNIEYNSSDTADIAPALLLNTSGGSFTTLKLNATMQNMRWKAFIGNVTGSFTLDSSTNGTIYDWSTSTISGNVYASRFGNIEWIGLDCAQPAQISNEETALNVDASKSDSISNTFANTVHRQFWAANNNIAQSSCPAIATYVNDQAQTNGVNNVFQEVMLEDVNNRILYATMLEDDTVGFDGQQYDFQMIVPEDDTTQDNTQYYFFVELI